ncbi:hypothetical protein RJ640_024415 [Escallonia rubra]|uniref:TMV resistance protein N-like n=1 Tax=Escallonia rubra TaxID=112253 RepID=A0AA88QV88_9ASTE|nr:hypothetical protein RJ640_024415 [Escallonia rubra]
MQIPILFTCRHESKVIQELVMDVFSKLDHPVANLQEDLVGIESHVDEVKSLLELGADDVRFIGIWGMGGIGKTTLASALFDNIVHQFTGGSIFLPEVREKSEKCGLECLQQKIISQILRLENVKVDSISHGIDWIRSTVCHKKALVILDDVDSMDQVNALAGNRDWFGKGSRIIITTRDKRILDVNKNLDEIICHEVCLLSETDSVMLFNLNAFGEVHHPKEFEKLSALVVEYAGGLPLALTVLGKSLYRRDAEMWESVVNRLKDIPADDIIGKLKVSYDNGLNKVEQEIFLDIACFFKGEEEDYANQVLGSFDFYPGIGIRVLVEKSFIVISNGKLQMHDLIQEMGWHIVRQVHPRQPGKYNRLWDPKEVHDVLTQNTGTEAVEGLQLVLRKATKVKFSSDALRKMDRLRLLKFHNVYLSQGFEYFPNQLRWLDLRSYPSKSLPQSFEAANLVGLEMPFSRLEQIWAKRKRVNKLEFIDLSHSEKLIRTPDFRDIPNLQMLVLKQCTSLVQVHQSIAFHKNLVLLNLGGCTNLRRLPDNIQLVSLEKLVLSDCKRLDKFPDIQGDMDRLSELYLDGTAIKEVPLSIERLKNLDLIDLSTCKFLESLPSSIRSLHSLRILLLSGCSKLSKLPENLGNLGCLEELDADGTAVIQLPPSIELLKKLKILSFRGCKPQSSISPFLLHWLPRLSSLRELYISYQNLLALPPDISCLSSLEMLDIRGNDFVNLPTSMSQFPRLQTLWLLGCKKLQVIPELPQSIMKVFADDCVSLQGLPGPLHRYTNLQVPEVDDGSFVLPGRDIPEHLGIENTGWSFSVRLPPQWDCYTLHPIKRIRRSTFFSRVINDSSSKRLSEALYNVKFGTAGKIGLKNVSLQYLREFVGPDEGCLIEYLSLHDRDSAIDSESRIDQGGGLLTYKKDVMVEDEMTVSPSNCHSQIRPNANSNESPLPLEASESGPSDTTATTEIKPPTPRPTTHPGAIHRRPGKEPARSKYETVLLMGRLAIAFDPEEFQGFGILPQAMIFNAPDFDRESSDHSDSPESRKHFASESDSRDEAAVENSKGEPARSILKRALGYLLKRRRQ